MNAISIRLVGFAVAMSALISAIFLFAGWIGVDKFAVVFFGSAVTGIANAWFARFIDRSGKSA